VYREALALGLVNKVVPEASLVEEVKDTDGQPYSEDLFRIARDRTISDQDLRRCDVLVDYLVKLHSQRERILRCTCVTYEI
jgi:enoyl-CoA hydratase/carnithine racemase